MEKIIIIGGSAGSFKIVNRILAAIPSGYQHPIVICMHRLRNVRSGFVSTLSLNSKFKIKEATDKEQIHSGNAYIAPSNYHLMCDYGHRFLLSVEPPVNHSRPSIDIAMDSAAEVFRDKTIGILLSGANSDGAKGMYKIYKSGGLTMVQDPEESDVKTMPESCLQLFKPAYIGNVETIIKFILELDS